MSAVEECGQVSGHVALSYIIVYKATGHIAGHVTSHIAGHVASHVASLLYLGF